MRNFLTVYTLGVMSVDRQPLRTFVPLALSGTVSSIQRQIASNPPVKSQENHIIEGRFHTTFSAKLGHTGNPQLQLCPIA
jgi:hypothetical protein